MSLILHMAASLAQSYYKQSEYVYTMNMATEPMKGLK